MAKILLVEDDNNLREIYEARLQAEGFEIVSAKDGEEALATAVKEKPDLIIADIMMPKISGFDMLDILRDTPETKDTKIIMMTALSQIEDKQKANKLGADRYLVKSQVTLEDVARVAHEVLDGKTLPSDGLAAANSGAAPVVPPNNLPPVNNDGQVQQPTVSNNIPITEPQPVSVPHDAPAADSSASNMTFSPPSTPTNDVSQSIPSPIPVSQPVVNQTVQPAAATTQTADNNAGVLAEAVKAVNGNDSAVTLESIHKHSVATNSQDVPNQAPNAQTEAQSKTVVHSKVISPINDISGPQTDLQALVAKEEAKSVENPRQPGQQAFIGDVKDNDKHVSLPGGDHSDPNAISL